MIEELIDESLVASGCHSVWLLDYFSSDVVVFRVMHVTYFLLYMHVVLSIWLAVHCTIMFLLICPTPASS
jgi:hypothetical protein